MNNETSSFCPLSRYSSDASSRHWFASANGCGFVSYFDRIFGDKSAIDRVYILIGGPGCGKSTLLRRIAEKAKTNGYSTELFHCSSAPSSLDGVIITERRLAVLDGTSPHLYSPSLAGVREITVDLGRAWDTDVLRRHAAEMEEFSEEKKRAYRRAYLYLQAADTLRRESDEYLARHILEDKMEKSCRAAVDKLKKNDVPQEKIRLQAAISGEGRVYTDGLLYPSAQVCHVTDTYGLGQKWLSLLASMARKKGVNMTVSYAPANGEPDGLYFPDDDLVYSLYADESRLPYRRINTSRFLDASVKCDRQKLRFLRKCRSSLEAEADEALKNACTIHARLEELYAVGTDYTVTESIGNELMRDIFG